MYNTYYPPPCPSLRDTKWACLVTERSEFNFVNVHRSTISTIYDQRCRWWTGQRSILGPPEPFSTPTTGIPPPTTPHTTPHVRNLFKIGRLFEAPKSSQNRPKSSQNPPQDPSKTAPKRRLMLQPPKIKNNATLQRFCSLLTFPNPRKSSQNRCKNAFKISFMLDTLLEP